MGREISRRINPKIYHSRDRSGVEGEPHVGPGAARAENLPKYVDDLDNVSCSACEDCEDEVDKMTYTKICFSPAGTGKFMDMKRKSVRTKGGEGPTMLLSPALKRNPYG